MRQMTAYPVIQKLTTYVFYRIPERHAQACGDQLLAAIYGLVARDEIAHLGFSVACVRVLLEEDCAGTLRDLAHVFRNFIMPAYDLVPEYDERSDLMRAARGRPPRLHCRRMVAHTQGYRRNARRARQHPGSRTLISRWLSDAQIAVGPRQRRSRRTCQRQSRSLEHVRRGRVIAFFGANTARETKGSI